MALGVDYVTEEISSRSVDTEAKNDGDEVQVALVPRIETSVRLVGGWHVFLYVGVELYLSQPRYVMKTELENVVILDTWFLQPVGLVGLSFNFAQNAAP